MGVARLRRLYQPVEVHAIIHKISHDVVGGNGLRRVGDGAPTVGEEEVGGELQGKADGGGRPEELHDAQGGRRIDRHRGAAGN